MSLTEIPLSWMQRHLSAAVNHGWSIDSLLSESMIELRYGDQRDVVGPEQALLLSLNTSLSVNVAHGMAQASMSLGYLAMGMTMALGCNNLERAIHMLSRLYESASHPFHCNLNTEGDEAILSVCVDITDEADGPYLEEVLLIFIFMQCLHFLGRTLPVSNITVRDPSHFNLGKAHWGMGGPVTYGSLTAFRFPRALLAAPPSSRAGPDVMWQCYRRFLAHADGSLFGAAPTDFVTADGFVRFADLVRQSGKSANTLRRHYQASKGGFREARQRTLIAAAQDRLLSSNEKVDSIAADLGYADARGFRRFLKLATGMTPQEIRNRGLAAGEQTRVWHKIKSLTENAGV